MKWIRSFGMFWYDFVVGDDWMLAIGVIVALGVTAILAHVAKVTSWWLLPIAVLLVVAYSVLRASEKIIRRMPSASPQPEAVPTPQEQPVTD